MLPHPNTINTFLYIRQQEWLDCAAAARSAMPTHEQAPRSSLLPGASPVITTAAALLRSFVTAIMPYLGVPRLGLRGGRHG